MKLDAENVEAIFLDCLFESGENTTEAKLVEGIVSNFGFHSERLAKHAEDIYSMLLQLPAKFQKETGGGWSFLNACNNKDDSQWTGFHLVMEHLFALGIATDKVQCLMPRELWSALPGGMPYYVVL